MKATHVFLLVLLLALAACSAPAQSAEVSLPGAASAGQPAFAATTAPTTYAPATAAPSSAARSATAMPEPSASPEATVPAIARTGALRSQPAPFNIGVPAGDAYAPFSAAIDSARNLAYVYHADSAERRPVIAVVDLAAGEVTRLIRLERAEAGASGRLFISPDGKRLFLQENQDMTVRAIDTGTGRLRKLLEGVRDAELSDDGRILYVVQAESVAAYSPADLMLGRTEPVWQSPGPYVRLALNEQRVLAATYGRSGALVVLDAATGRQIAQGDVSETADAIAAGPNGSWALVVGGERPRLIRYDAELKVRGETAVLHTSSLTYDALRNRYLVGGYRYSESEPAGHQVVLSLDASDGRPADEVRWMGAVPPTVFEPWGDDALVAFAAGSLASVFILDAPSLAVEKYVPTGIRAEDVVLDDQAQRLYVADDLGRVHVLKLPGGERLSVWEGASPLALDRANGRLYVNRSTGVVALNTADGTVLARFPQRGHPAPDPNADLIYLVNRGVTIYDRSGRQLGTLPSTFPVERGFSPNPYAYAAHVNPVTGHLAVIMNNGIPGSNGGTYLRVYPRQSDKAVEPAAPHSFVMDLTTDREGNWYVAYSPARTQDALYVLSPDGRQLGRLDHRTGHLALDEARDRLYLFIDGRVTQLAASSLTATEVYQGPEFVSRLEFSPATLTAYMVQYSGPLVTPVHLDALAALDLRPVPGRPSSEAYNDGIVVVGAGRQRMVVGRFGAPYRTSDGTTWQRLLPGVDMSLGYLTAAAPRTLFVTGRSPAGGEGVWRSIDGGDTWEFLAAGLTDLAPAWPVLANSAREAYFVNQGQGLLRWDAAGRKWQVVSRASPTAEWSGLSLAPDGTLFRSNDTNLERSTDRGATWERLGPRARTGDVIGFSALYTATQTLFSAVRTDYRFSSIQRSTDGGKTWQPSLSSPTVDFDGYQPEMATGFGMTYLLLRPYDGDPVLLRTADAGETWKKAPADAVTGVDHIAVDPLDGRLWLGTKGSVRTLDPEKLVWTAVSRGHAAAATATGSTAPTATPCPQALAGGDAEINARGLGLGCPVGITKSVQMARQGFQNGQMIWREDRRVVYVLYDDGRWDGYEDRWAEGDPADDPKIIAPSGLQQPARGFGKVWREQLGGAAAAIGWALEKERGLEGLAQDWDHGIVLRFGGEVIVLLERGEWR